MPIASAACQCTAILFAAALAARPVMAGGVLSMVNGSLTSLPVRAWSGGFAGASDAVTRMRYSPSGNAVESQLRRFSETLSLSGFHSVSSSPLISIV